MKFRIEIKQHYQVKKTGFVNIEAKTDEEASMIFCDSHPAVNWTSEDHFDHVESMKTSLVRLDGSTALRRIKMEKKENKK